jgi:hypothetical protein
MGANKREVIGCLSELMILLKVLPKISERRRFTIPEVSSEIPQILRTVLYEIIKATIG